MHGNSPKSVPVAEIGVLVFAVDWPTLNQAPQHRTRARDLQASPQEDHAHENKTGS